MNYGGVYRAKCLSIQHTSFVVVIPQVFGTEKVMIFSRTGPMPKLNDQGWVAFESGEASLPVWISGPGAVATGFDAGNP